MLTVLQTALEVGLIYGLVALALFISFSILNIGHRVMIAKIIPRIKGGNLRCPH